MAASVNRKSARRHCGQAAGPTAVAMLVLTFTAALLAGCGNAASRKGGKNGAAKQEASASSTPARKAAQQAKESEATPPPQSPDSVEVPEEMVYIPGGETRIGITERAWKKVQRLQKPGARPPWGRGARPSFLADVEPFFLAKHPTTVAQFRQFVEQTGYRTQAEKFGNAGVMWRGRWRLVEGATWHHPLGPSAEAAQPNHPVTQVSYNDAAAYCKAQGRRLPTEVEWEHAARGAENDRDFCPWNGACDRQSRLHNANTWQGRFPVRNTVEDGYRRTSPVGAFGETELGLTDMSGNVWEWTSSWYRPYSERGTSYEPTKQSEKVQRGGSFQCNECGGYRVFARSHSTPETSLFHVGFRCAKDIPAR